MAPNSLCSVPCCVWKARKMERLQCTSSHIRAHVVGAVPTLCTYHTNSINLKALLN
jgi:hypothetical protein